MEALKLYETRHPQKDLHRRYDSLVGLDAQKHQLLENLKLVFSTESIKAWQKKHHPKGLAILESALYITPLILLSGDVGCGKTELASCIGTPLSEALDKITIRVFETPSDTRGSGRVGELSARITAAFRSAASQLKPREKGILIIDEADDLATGRDQQQAHHEDRAGVNALIKEIDRLKKEQILLAVLLITNRTRVMDPAILRRAMVDIRFQRPTGHQIQEVLEHLLEDVECSTEEIRQMVELCKAQTPLFSYSDFFTRILKQALLRAKSQDQPYSANMLLETIQQTQPSPQISQL